MSGSGRTGRPPGADPETLERGRLYHSLADHGVSVATIAAHAGVGKSEVYRAMRLVRPLAPVEAEQAGSRNSEPRHPPAAKKMSEGTLLRRAYAAIRNVKAFKRLLDAQAREFWVEAMIEILALAEDGVELTFGQPGDVYHSQAEFMSVFDADEAQLEALFHHAMLVDLGGHGVALPYRWGFREKPSLGRKENRSLQLRPKSTYGVVQGGLSDSGESRLSPDESGLSPDEQEGLSPDESEGLSPESDGLARDVTTTTTSERNQPFSRSGCPESRAHVSGESPANVSGESPDSSGESPVGLSGESPRADATLTKAASVAKQIGLLCGCGDPDAGDLETVRSWLRLPGISEELILRAIKDDRDQPDPLPVRSYALFTKVIKGALSVEKAKGGRKGPPSALPLSDADKALRDLLKPSSDAWIKNRSCPFAPTLDSFKSACATEKGSIVAHRWLELWSVWDDSGRPADLKPPDFTLMAQDPHRFETALLEIEEELTAPTPPQAAD